ncbi:Protein of unknown function [Lactobacillus delbrueckii subsp. bulgaricus]|nr:Protein of unknown function [Lactobacillus delbrueckii subsp. bulgaricus]
MTPVKYVPMSRTAGLVTYTAKKSLA